MLKVSFLFFLFRVLTEKQLKAIFPHHENEADSILMNKPSMILKLWERMKEKKVCLFTKNFARVRYIERRFEIFFVFKF